MRVSGGAVRVSGPGSATIAAADSAEQWMGESGLRRARFGPRPGFRGRCSAGRRPADSALECGNRTREPGCVSILTCRKDGRARAARRRVVHAWRSGTQSRIDTPVGRHVRFLTCGEDPPPPPSVRATRNPVTAPNRRVLFDRPAGWPVESRPRAETGHGSRARRLAERQPFVCDGPDRRTRRGNGTIR